MKTGHWVRKFAGWASVCTLIGTTPVSYAAMVVYEDVGFFTGLGNNSESFEIETAGAYKATLTDFKFPGSFTNDFGLMVTTSTLGMDRTSGPGSFTFQATPGTYWASVYGLTAEPADLGLYGVKIEQMDQQVVMATPIPAAFVLLASALMVYGGFGRGKPRSKKQDSGGVDAVLPA